MNVRYNVYCDESCHLENDRQKAMVLGAVCCQESMVHDIALSIRNLKVKHGVRPTAELKWTSVSPSKVALYRDVVSSFMDSPALRFRAVVVPDKSVLDHQTHGHDHDTFYYKMYFLLLRQIIGPHDTFNIYLDIKDTRGSAKIRKLHEVLCNAKWDFSQTIISRVQIIRSHETELNQLADVLCGAVSYVNRGLSGSTAKSALVDLLKQRTGYSLVRSTLYREEKFNILVWRPSEDPA